MVAFIVLLITLLSIFPHGFALSHSNANHRGLTNAQRFARGLPPAPPKRYFGSRSESARRSSVSAIPGTLVQGIIQFGSLGTTYYIGANGGVQTNAINADPFGYIDPPSSSSPVQLVFLDGSGNPTSFYLAFGSPEATTLTDESNNDVELIDTQTTTPLGSAPQTDTLNYVETTIFVIDPTTGDVTLTWFNPGAPAQAATDLVLSTDGSLVYLGSGSDYQRTYLLDPVDSITFVQT